jgi:endonuclease/exonuclease/phosphatase (EEP) superfamily protein YafD
VPGGRDVAAIVKPCFSFLFLSPSFFYFTLHFTTTVLEAVTMLQRQLLLPSSWLAPALGRLGPCIRKLVATPA